MERSIYSYPSFNIHNMIKKYTRDRSRLTKIRRYKKRNNTSLIQ